MTEEAIIEKLAAACGIEPEYRDNWGRIHPTSIEAKKSILNAMGLTVDSPEPAKEAWHATLARKWSNLSDPTIVVNVSDPPKKLFFQMPVRAQGEAPRGLKVSLIITDEQGEKQEHYYTQTDLSSEETVQTEGRTYHRWGIPFPRVQTLGYYSFHLSVLIGGLQSSQIIFVAICPEKAYIPTALQGDARAAGISISLYGVRSERNWGIGDFGDLREILDWVAEDLHGSIVGLNPLHAIFNRRPFNTSPYLPMSRFYRNYVYLDVPAMEDYRDSPEARTLVNASETQGLLSELRASKTVQYEQVAGLKQKVLRQVFQTFLENHWNRAGNKTDRHQEIENYVEREGLLLENFATFCALDSTIRSANPTVWIWSQWPPEYQRPDTEAVRQFRQEHRQEILFHKYLQWQIEKQLSEVQAKAEKMGMCIGLYHDLALAIDRFGSDSWAYQESFLPAVHVGAPPDAFSQQGQDWGFPPPDIKKIQEDGYHLFVKEIQKNCAFGGALRIDHIMRFFHLYFIPEGKLPNSGAYVSQPFGDLLGILALESIRNQVVIIGEDLGTVPVYIRDRLKDANVLSYRLLYFEKDDQQDFMRPESYPELALVTVATHDLPTLAGFWTHRDIEVRKDAGMLDTQQAVIRAAAEREADKRKMTAVFQDLNLLPEDFDENESVYAKVTGEIHNAVVGFLALTPAKLFILSQEDLFKDPDQQNLPGSTSEYPNWSLKMKYTVEELRSGKASEFCDMFRNWIDRSGRNKKQPLNP